MKLCLHVESKEYFPYFQMISEKYKPLLLVFLIIDFSSECWQLLAPDDGIILIKGKQNLSVFGWLLMIYKNKISSRKFNWVLSRFTNHEKNQESPFIRVWNFIGLVGGCSIWRYSMIIERNKYYKIKKEPILRTAWNCLLLSQYAFLWGRKRRICY